MVLQKSFVLNTKIFVNISKYSDTWSPKCTKISYYTQIGFIKTTKTKNTKWFFITYEIFRIMFAQPSCGCVFVLVSEGAKILRNMFRQSYETFSLQKSTKFFIPLKNNFVIFNTISSQCRWMKLCMIYFKFKQQRGAL